MMNFEALHMFQVQAEAVNIHVVINRLTCTYTLETTSYLY